MAGRFQVQHLAKEPAGWKVRSKRVGSHVLRIAFPPGRRKRGSGKLLEVLHPKANPQCAKKTCDLSKKNPSELLIFGNPAMPISPGELNELQALYGRAPASAQSHSDKVNWAASEFNKRHPGKRAAARAALRATNPKGRKTRATKKTVTRRNPSDTSQAVKLFESFHGKDATEIIEAQRSAAMRLDYTGLGPLIALGFEDGGFPESRLKDKWDQCNHIDFDGDGVMLASAPTGKQLYFIGGNQNLDSSLSMFEGVDTAKDLIDLGDVVFVVYEARKVHDNFAPADYCHRFGGHGKTLPRLAYDKLKKEMLLIGGEYLIDTKAGISPGIEG